MLWELEPPPLVRFMPGSCAGSSACSEWKSTGATGWLPPIEAPTEFKKPPSASPRLGAAAGAEPPPVLPCCAAWAEAAAISSAAHSTAQRTGLPRGAGARALPVACGILLLGFMGFLLVQVLGLTRSRVALAWTR